MDKELLYIENGDMSITEANAMNVPVNIFINEEGDGFEMWASNFMPRKERIAQSQYHLKAKDRQTLMAVIQKYVVPLYEAALLNLKNTGSNYYWEQEHG